MKFLHEEKAKTMTKKNSLGSITNPQQLAKQLQAWYLASHRPLPWRADKNPYKIWISEVMLQQTTVQAVMPFYQRFLERFPDVQTLADSSLEKVLESWAGLGYYRRARLLHACAQKLKQTGFPKKAEELIQLPGMGPYTSRAISSIAFSEAVGVLDGNVIRVLSRLYAFNEEWWKNSARQKLQQLSDQLNQKEDPSIINQALMELGATVCTPTSPTCAVCPWVQSCQAHQQNLVTQLPLKKPRKAMEPWLWDVQLAEKKGLVAFVKDSKSPVLKNHWIFPGEFQKLKKKPTKFDLKHTITHHEIFVRITKSSAREAKKDWEWMTPEELKRQSPFSILQKILSSASLLIFLFLQASCSHSTIKTPFTGPSVEKASDSIQAPPTLDPGMRWLSLPGQNSEGVFSSDGKKVLYASHLRTSHEQFQIYEYDLILQRERRLTYQLGDANEPQYLSPEEILFTSSTDEIKETPQKMIPKEESDKMGTPVEIYSMNLRNFSTERWTQHPGRDAQISLVGNKGAFLWLQQKESKTQQAYFYNGKETVPVQLPLEKQESVQMTLSGNHFEDAGWILKTTDAPSWIFLRKSGKSWQRQVLPVSDLVFARRVSGPWMILISESKPQLIQSYHLEQKKIYHLHTCKERCLQADVSADKRLLLVSEQFSTGQAMYLKELSSGLFPETPEILKNPSTTP